MDELKKELIAEAKLKGLDLAEDGLRVIAELFFDMIPRIAEKTENKIDDIVAPMIVMMKPKVMELIDSIDGQKN